ncbi:MAG TPA: hypothetical protein VIL49_16875 [Capillimicrobium sp.]|jgi:hypothetical protein
MTKALALTTLALAVLPATAAQAAEATFKVSLYGIQRYDKLDHEEADENTSRCWDSRGDITEKTVMRFQTTKPILMKVSSYKGSLSIYATGKNAGAQLPLQVQTKVEHSGSYIKEEKACTDGQDGWILDPPPIAVNCSATVDNLGFGLQGGQGGRLEVSGGEIESLAKDPFDGCPYGDHSDLLYTAKGRIKASDLLASREAEVVLRGGDKNRYEGTNGSFVDSRSKTTVYLTLKKVGR